MYDNKMYTTITQQSIIAIRFGIYTYYTFVHVLYKISIHIIDYKRTVYNVNLSHRIE
jgi:hypothetical protein